MKILSNQEKAVEGSIGEPPATSHFQDFIDIAEVSLIINIFITLLFALVICYAARKTIRYVLKQEHIPEWVRSLVNAFYTPSLWLVWGFSALIILDELSTYSTLFITPATLQNVRRWFLIAGITIVILNWKKSFEYIFIEKIIKKENEFQSKTTINVISKVITIVILSIAFLVALGGDISHILAIGGFGSVVIGIAGKEIFANFLTGFMIHFNKRFVIGDLIRSIDKNFEGHVEEIGWGITRLKTLAKEPLYIPNSIFADSIIENRTRMKNKRIHAVVGVRYADIAKISAITKDLKVMMQEHPDLDPKLLQIAHFINFGQSCLNIDLICFTKTIDLVAWRNTQQDIFLKTADIIKKHGAEIAFPSRFIYINNPETTPKVDDPSDFYSA